MVMNRTYLNAIVGSAYCVAIMTILLDLAYGKWFGGAVLHEGWKHKKRNHSFQDPSHNSELNPIMPGSDLKMAPTK